MTIRLFHLVLCLVVILSFQEVNAEESTFAFRPSASSVQSKTYQGKDYGFSIQDKINPDVSFLIGHQQFIRKYNEGGVIDDRNFILGSAWKWNEDHYIESEVTGAPGAEILPRWSMTLTPHWVSGVSDFGLGLNYRETKLVKSAALHPYYIYVGLDPYTFTAGAFLVRTDKLLLSGHAQASMILKEHMFLSLNGSGGRALEDVGLETNFNYAFAEIGYIANRWKFFFSGGQYQSDLRTEDVFGIRLELK